MNIDENDHPKIQKLRSKNGNLGLDALDQLRPRSADSSKPPD
jgi:hypothetical protein